MKILIFGAQGFIGRFLARNLQSKGHKVIIFDRHKKTNVDDEFFMGDIKDRDAVIDAVSYCDMWVNLAGLLGTQEMMENPIPAIDVNIKGALNVFDAARMHKKRGLQIAVGNYWMNNPYSITKNTTERLALMYNKEHGTDIRVVRGMNVYGPEQKHRPIRKIFPNLVIPALLNKPITIYGDGEQIMDLIYVEDIAEVLARVLLNDDAPNHIIYEAGCGGGMTINWAVNEVLRLTNSSSEVTRVPMRPGEEERAVVEISDDGWRNLETYIGYTKNDLTPTSEAIKKSIDWYKEHLEEFPWDE